MLVKQRNHLKTAALEQNDQNLGLVTSLSLEQNGSLEVGMSLRILFLYHTSNFKRKLEGKIQTAKLT